MSQNPSMNSISEEGPTMAGKPTVKYANKRWTLPDGRKENYVNNMRAILEFNLPDDQESFNASYHSGQFVSCVEDTLNHIRTALKHGHNFKTPEEALDSVRKIIIDCNLPEL